MLRGRIKASKLAETGAAAVGQGMFGLSWGTGVGSRVALNTKGKWRNPTTHATFRGVTFPWAGAPTVALHLSMALPNFGRGMECVVVFGASIATTQDAPSCFQALHAETRTGPPARNQCIKDPPVRGTQSTSTWFPLSYEAEGQALGLDEPASDNKDRHEKRRAQCASLSAPTPWP